MENIKRAKFVKICGVLLIVCGFIGFWYVMFGGGKDVQPKDAMITILFLGVGTYLTWLGLNPDRLQKK